jgi:hypothetical protein
MIYAPAVISVHNHGMKTRANVNLDADAYEYASAYAAARGIALGAAISELLRRLQQTPKSPEIEFPHLKRSPRGFLVIPKNGQVITPEMVKEFSEDDLS